MSLTAILPTTLLHFILTLALAFDGGVPDAGAPAAPLWNWVDGDGGWLLDGGVTDILTLQVGQTARVVFPFPIVLMQCDEALLGLGANEDTLLLTGLDAGHTSCGFWFYKRAWPHRFMDVTVSRDSKPRAP